MAIPAADVLTRSVLAELAAELQRGLRDQRVHGVGFVGAYDFVLGGRHVRIVLNPKGSGRVGPQTVIDLADGLIVAGWAAGNERFRDVERDLNLRVGLDRLVDRGRQGAVVGDDREAARGSIEVLWPRATMARTVRADWTLVYVVAGTGAFGLMARVGDLVSRQRGGKTFLALEEGEKLLPPSA